MTSPNLSNKWIFKISEHLGNPSYGIYDCQYPYFTVNPNFGYNFKTCNEGDKVPTFEVASEFEKDWMNDCISKNIGNSIALQKPLNINIQYQIY